MNTWMAKLKTNRKKAIYVSLESQHRETWNLKVAYRMKLADANEAIMYDVSKQNEKNMIITFMCRSHTTVFGF